MVPIGGRRHGRPLVDKRAMLALVFLMAIGIGCSLWARGARVDPSDSKAAAAAPNEETEEPLQVV